MKYIDINRKNVIPTLSRISPIIFLIILIFNCILVPGYRSYYLFIIYIILILSNSIIKNIIAKPLYNLLNVKSLPILGIGARPNGASSCGFILDNKLGTSFGMPSGHSQIAWAIATYIIVKSYKTKKITFNNIFNNIFNYIWLILSYLLILVCTIYISYSRVNIERCHTYEQVIVGGILGICCGLLIYYYEDSAITFFSKL